LSDDHAVKRSLILDYGNVLSRSQRGDCVARMAARLGVPTHSFYETYVSERPAYDAGEAPAEYWRRLIARLGRSSVFSQSLVGEMIEEDTVSWSDPREEVWEIAARFRERGGRAAFLSNNVPPLMARLRHERRLDEVFDVVIASCEVGLVKPDPAIFERCIEALGVAPGDALFVDDHRPNIDAAARLGIRTFYFDGDGATARLRSAAESLSESD
jgi:putative hydrolase of the HAD superfamily